MSLRELKTEISLEEAMQTWDAVRVARTNEVRAIEKAKADSRHG